MAQRLRRLLFPCCCAAAAVAALMLMQQRGAVADQFVGLVEATERGAAPLIGGRIDRVLVALGERVAAGQPLAQLDQTDLDAELARLERDLTANRALAEQEELALAAENHRVAMAHADGLVRLRDAVAQYQLDLDAYAADLAARRAEVAALDAEVARVRGVVAAGLGQAELLGELTIKRDAAAQYLAAAAAGLADRRRRLEQAAAAHDAAEARDVRALLKPAVPAQARRIEEITAAIAAAGERRRQRAVLAPCTGTVVRIDARAGDVVPDLAPVVTVQDAAIAGLDAYLPETARTPLAEGGRVAVTPLGAPGPVAEGGIQFIHPGYSLIPAQLLPGATPTWGRKVRIVLDRPDALLPQQRVGIAVLPATTPLAPARSP